MILEHFEKNLALPSEETKTDITDMMVIKSNLKDVFSPVLIIIVALLMLG